MTCYHPNLRRCPAVGCQCNKLLCEDCGPTHRDENGNQTFNLITPIDVGVDPAPRKAWANVTATVIIVDITDLANMTVVGKVEI
jgi:hypothetical protein